MLCLSVAAALSSLNALAATACDEKAGDYATCIAQLYRQPVAQWPAPQVDADVDWQEMAALPDHAPAPPENPFSDAQAELVAVARRTIMVIAAVQVGADFAYVVEGKGVTLLFLLPGKKPWR